MFQDSLSAPSTILFDCHLSSNYQNVSIILDKEQNAEIVSASRYYIINYDKILQTFFFKNDLSISFIVTSLPNSTCFANNTK